jgi:hypothetical protein
MRIPFEFNESKFEDSARIKFLYNSPELHQNIEISIDGNEISVETLLETFERFLGALGVHVPENVYVGFLETVNESNEDDSEVSFELDDEDEEDIDDDNDFKNKKKK